jgi:hypothetical protein
MAKTRRDRRGATTYATDEKLIAHLAEHRPGVVKLKVPEEGFGATLDAILAQPLTDEIQHFYCRPCGEYHLKTHPHFLSQPETRKVRGS